MSADFGDSDYKCVVFDLSFVDSLMETKTAQPMVPIFQKKIAKETGQW